MKKGSAIVIGSGFGGLACAIRLQHLGFKTFLLEKLPVPGGRAQVFEQQGFIFDAGPTVITAPHLFTELFELSQRSLPVKMLPIHPFYELCWEDGYKFYYTNDEAHLKDQILKKNPHDWQNYQKFLTYTKKVFEEGYEKLVDKAFLKFSDMLRCAPALMKLSAHRTVYSMVSKFIENEQLRQAFSFHALLVGGSPFRTSSIYTLIHFLEKKWGVFFPQGGTHALVKALVALFEQMGGTIYLNAPVQRIEVQNNHVTGVTLHDQNFLAANVVVSNADVVQTYGKLLSHHDYGYKMYKKTARKKHSMSLVVIYFGVSKKYPHQSHHQVIFGKRYKGLLEDIFKRKILSSDFSLYLHAPTVTDRSLAPEGCETFYVLSPVPHLGSSIDWNQIKEEYAEKIINFLDTFYLKDLKKHLVTKIIFTPLDFESQYFSHLGAAFSFEPTLLQSAYFRAHNKDPYLEGLYFVGAGTHPGAGIPGVLNSAKATAATIAQQSFL